MITIIFKFASDLNDYKYQLYLMNQTPILFFPKGILN